MYTLGEAKVILFCRITRLTINSRAKGCRSEGLWRGTNRPLVGLGGPLAENLSTAMRLVKSGEKPVGGLSEYRCEGSASHRLKSARRPSLARCCHARNESGWTRLSLREGPPAPGTRLRQFSADHERGRRPAQARPAQPFGDGVFKRRASGISRTVVLANKYVRAPRQLANAHQS